MQYPIAIYLKDQQYYVIIPDIPELQAQGKNMGDAVANARTTVINHLYTLLDQDKTLPQPTAVAAHLTNPKFAGCTWAIVGIEMSRIMGDTLEISVNLPNRLFKQVAQTYPDTPIDSIIITALKQYLNKKNS